VQKVPQLKVPQPGFAPLKNFGQELVELSHFMTFSDYGTGTNCQLTNHKLTGGTPHTDALF